MKQAGAAMTVVDMYEMEGTDMVETDKRGRGYKISD